MKGNNMNYLWTDNAMQSGTLCNVDVVNENLMHLKYSNNALTPFCVNSGNLDATGKASLLTYSSGTLSFKIGGSYPNAELTYADFSKETLQSLTVISSMSNGVNTIIKKRTKSCCDTKKRDIRSIIPSSPDRRRLSPFHCLRAATNLQICE
jgi:hypothetical protein